MNTRKRRLDERVTPPVNASEEERTRANDARDAGAAFLRAADAALDRALSGSPEEFLRQNRQLGGQ